LRLIHQRLIGVLESNNVTPFEGEGRQFDPMVHEAMSVVERDEYQSGAVHTENRRGYF
jgi:molecular chaperone GrpE (heat shock protein)